MTLSAKRTPFAGPHDRRVKGVAIEEADSSPRWSLRSPGESEAGGPEEDRPSSAQGWGKD